VIILISELIEKKIINKKDMSEQIENAKELNYILINSKSNKFNYCL
jgi:hypothetical protein